MTTQTIRTIDGRELYVCEVETLREAVERAVRERANLTGAELAGANLTGANLAGATLIDAGQESRGYRFVGVPTDGVRILAGCRWFTVTEAREHWSGNPEALAKASLIEAEASRRGWIA